MSTTKPFQFNAAKFLEGENEEETNGRRASRAENTVRFYQEHQLQDSIADESNATDLISDLCHYFDREGRDARSEIESAINRWEEER